MSILLWLVTCYLVYRLGLWTGRELERIELGNRLWRNQRRFLTDLAAHTLRPRVLHRTPSSLLSDAESDAEWRRINPPLPGYEPEDA